MKQCIISEVELLKLVLLKLVIHRFGGVRANLCDIICVMNEVAQNRRGAPLGGPPKKRRFVLGFIGLLVAAFFLFVGVNWFNAWRETRAIDQIAEGLVAYEKEVLARQMADTVGGATPQETLTMYIAAVESGDYELASSYFVESARERWRGELQNIADSEKMDVYLGPLKEVLLSEGEYSRDRDSFSFNDPVGVDLILYPNSVWKLVDI